MDIINVCAWPNVQTALVGTFVFLLVMTYLRRKRYRLPPGPPQLPILGNYFAFSKDVRLFTVFAEMEKKYGDIFTVNFGFGHNSIVVSSVDLVNELLVEKSEEFAGRDTSLWSLYLISGGYKDIAFSDHGPVWTLQKKMAVKVIRSYVFSGKLDCLAKSAFEEVAPLLSKQPEPLDVDIYINLLIYNMICRISFGKSYEIDDPEFVWLRKKYAENMTVLFGSRLPADLIPFLKHVPIPSTLRAKRIANELKDFHMRKLKEHEVTLNPENVRDLTDQLLLARQEYGKSIDGDVKEVLTDDHIIQIVSNTFIAGTVSSTETFKWILLCVADKPDVQENMYQEIMDVFDVNDLHQSKARMKYCEAVFKETLRLRPAGPCAIAHKALRDTTLGGYDIPKDTVVYPNFWVIHFDPRNWESPEEFKPERFLSKDGASKKNDHKIWLPFSAGKRKCPGEAVARSNLLISIAMFFRQFKVAVPPGQKLDLEPDMYQLDCITKPQKIVIEPRE